MPSVKVVLHRMMHGGRSKFSDKLYGPNGLIHSRLERDTGFKIDFVSFYGEHLEGKVLELFLKKCKNAHVVVVDAWNHPLNQAVGEEIGVDPYLSMASIVQGVININPCTEIFAVLMEGIDKVAVHEIAEPIKEVTDRKILEAVKRSVHKSGQPRILVFDDSKEHLDAARKQLADCNLVVASTYSRAEAMIKREIFDYVLLDLLVPASARTQGEEGMRHVGQKMPITPLLAFLALSKGMKKVAILTDTNHHHHPASAAIDIFSGKPFFLGDARVLLSNRTFTSEGAKDWSRLIKQLDL